MLFEIDTDGTHVAHGLPFGLFKSKVQTSFAPAAGMLRKSGGKTALPRASRAGNKNRRALIKAFALQHCVQIPNACGNAVIGDGVIETHRGTGENGEPTLINEERIFVRAVRSAAVFYHAHAAG